MVQGVEEPHSSGGQEDRLQCGQQDVDAPEVEGRLLDPRGELLGRRSGDLRLVELHPPDPEEGEHGEAQDDDPHPAYPVRQAARSRR